MRQEAIAEVGGSLIIATITGLFTIGGIASGFFACLALPASLNALGIILLLIGILNLPTFMIWSRQTANEISMWSHPLTPDARHLRILR
jgi:hypothetical protein